MRGKTLEKVGLSHSSTKIWTLQRDANSKVKLKSSKQNFEENTELLNEYLVRLETSHEITLKFAKYVEERLHCTHKIYTKARSLIDNSPASPLKFPNQLEELELIRYKDIFRFKDMEISELRLLDQFSSRHIHKETDLLVIIEQVKDKLIHYDRALQSLDQQIDNITSQNRSQQLELQEVLLEFKEKVKELEKNKACQSGTIEKIREENRVLSLQNSHLKNSIEEFARNEKKITEKYTREIGNDHEEIQNLRRAIREKNEGQSDRGVLRDLVGIVKDITHKAFEKYATSQSEWIDASWKEEFGGYKGEYKEMLLEIEFLCFLIGKLSNDNNWLVDRLAEIGKTNYKLSGDGKSPTPNRMKEEVLCDLQAASNALKEFEEARENLLSQFS